MAVIWAAIAAYLRVQSGMLAPLALLAAAGVFLERTQWRQDE
jgi:hypothetical protein